MLLPRGRAWITVGTLTLALLVLVFPPWRARAIRTTTRYAAISNVAPATVVDTLTWTVAFAPIYAPPRVGLTAERMRELAVRALSGDTGAAAELRRSAAEFEGPYHVPEVLRVSGELWRDSVLAKAGIPAVGGYDLTFVLDERWIAARLMVLGLIALVAENRRRYSGPRRLRR